MDTDPLGYVYLVRGETITRYTPDGKKINQYSNKRLGAIRQFDCSNPMKILLFYPEFNQVVFLDNQLSENGSPIGLENFELDQAVLACSSHDNGIWVYDQRNFEMVRLDQSMQVTHKTGNIPQQIGKSANPSFIRQSNNWVYLYDPDQGLMVFDIFGTYNKTIPLMNVKDIQFSSDAVTYNEQGMYYRLDPFTLQRTELPLPRAGAIQLRLEKSRLYLRYADETLGYQMQ